jgi:hypothetical protein
VPDPIPWIADQVEAMFHAALKEGDTQGVEAAITVMLRLDPRRAIALWDDLKLAVDFTQRILRPATDA